MSNIDLAELEFIEKQYYLICSKVVQKVENFKKAHIQIKHNLKTIEQLDFSIEITNDEMLKNMAKKLDTNNIPFSQSGNTIKTTLSGVISCCNISTPQEQSKLAIIEKKIFEKFNKKYDLKTFVMVNTKNGPRWAANADSFDNIYYLKSLRDAENVFSTGYIKSPYSLFNVHRWRIPCSINTNWEAPSTITPVITNSKKISRDINFINSLDKKVGNFEHILKSSLDIGVNCRQNDLLIESIIREIKLFIEIKNSLKLSNQNDKKKTLYKLLRTIELEFEHRKKLIKRDKSKSPEKLTEISDKLNSNIESILSETTRNQIEYNKYYINILSNIKQFYGAKDTISEGTTSNQYINENNNASSSSKYSTDLNELYSPMASMLNILSLSEGYTALRTSRVSRRTIWSPQSIDAILDAVSDLAISTGQVIAFQEASYTMAELIADCSFAGYNAGTCIYATLKTIAGTRTVMSINEWISETQQSKIIDEETKGLITDYLKSQKSHTIWGECVGHTLLSVGQIMITAGYPLWGFGAPVILPGAGLTLLGVGIKLSNRLIKGKKFNIIEEPNTKELSILQDDQSIPQSGILEGETRTHANLRWKAELLKNESLSNENNLFWINVLSEVIKNCDESKKRHLTINPDIMEKKILKAVEKRYRFKFLDNMQKTVKINISKKDTSSLVRSYINQYTKDPQGFYKVLIENFILCKSNNKKHSISASDKDDKVEIKLIDNRDKSLYMHPKYNSIISLIDMLKDSNLWIDVQKNLLKTLIITNKSGNNIRGSQYAGYINKINIEENRLVYVPAILPIKMIFRSPVAPYKNKTAYSFNTDNFIENLKKYALLSKKERANIDDVIQTLFDINKNSVGKAITQKGELNLKSDVFRPLWLEIPQIVRREIRDM